MSDQPRSTTVTVHIAAPRERVFRAFVDAADVGLWMVPDGMTSEVHAFEGREGGTFRISLTYVDQDEQGKTTANTDTYHGRFTELVEPERVVQVIEFETADPGMQGESTVTVTLVERGGGTEVTAVHSDLPPALDAAANELGWGISLGKLARLVGTLEK